MLKTLVQKLSDGESNDFLFNQIQQLLACTAKAYYSFFTTVLPQFG
jgi:hypothetical protein